MVKPEISLAFPVCVWPESLANSNLVLAGQITFTPCSEAVGSCFTALFGLLLLQYLINYLMLS